MMDEVDDVRREEAARGRAEEDRRKEEAIVTAEERERRREQDDKCKHAEQRSVEREERKMTGRDLHRQLFEHYADNGVIYTTWEEMDDRDHQVWELTAAGVVERSALTGAFDRIGGVPDRNEESPESFSERVEATDAHRIAFDVALILTEDA